MAEHAKRHDDAAPDTGEAAPNAAAPEASKRAQSSVTAPGPANSNPAGSPRPPSAAARPARAPEPSLLRKAGAVVGGIALVAAVGGLVLFLMNGDDTPAPKRVQEIVVNIVPPPPPPPPPPQPEQKLPEPEMVEQPKMVEPEIKEEKPVEQPKEAPPEDSPADEPPPGPLGLDAAAEGPGDSFNLAGRPGGRGLGLGGGGGGGGSKWGWYASMVQQQIEAALRRNARTRNAVMQIRLRLWADATGRVTRVQMVSSTGDAGLDATLRNEIFPGIVLREPPPRDMPMPLNTRVTARRPT